MEIVTRFLLKYLLQVCIEVQLQHSYIVDTFPSWSWPNCDGRQVNMYTKCNFYHINLPTNEGNDICIMPEI